MKLIHYAEEPIISLENRAYDQSEMKWQAKPNGLWISIEGLSYPNNYNWKEWCEAEQFRVEYLVNPYEVVLHDNANILH